MYFGPDEELACVNYLASKDDAERNKIFDQWLSAPLAKMAELIIKKYKLYRKGMTLEEQCHDTLGFLMTKAHLFEPAQGKKAYSYYGTICKHYNLGLIQKEEKMLRQTTSFEEVYDNLEERQELSYVIDSDTFSMDNFIKNLSDGIRLELDDEVKPSKKKLNDNERKVGEALIEILEHWETAFDSMSGGSKYNKNSVLQTMRDYTHLSTKDIRLAMKRFKELYEILKHHGL